MTTNVFSGQYVVALVATTLFLLVAGAAVEAFQPVGVVVVVAPSSRLMTTIESFGLSSSLSLSLSSLSFQTYKKRRAIVSRQPWHFQFSSTMATRDGGGAGGTNATLEEPSLQTVEGKRRTDLDMPWSQAQEWALRDKLSQYTITAPVVVNVDMVNREHEQQEQQTTVLKSYILWRALTDNVVELAGYPLSFLAQRCNEILQDDSSPKQQNKIEVEILPYLDDYTFEATGGLSGRIYGIRGVAEGTRIQTTPVTQVERTLPKGFVQTADGQILYELGKPAATATTAASVNNKSEMAQRVAASLIQTTTAASTKLAAAVNTNKNNNENEQQLAAVLDSDLVNLAALTAVMGAGAVAMQTLSHHLTVNMFWV